MQLLNTAGRVIGADTGEGFFTILGKVDLVRPGQGDTVYAGTTRFVCWESGRIPGVASTLLKISTDGGKSWRTLGMVPGNPGSYTWHVPPGDVTPDKCRIRVVMRNSRGTAVAAADGRASLRFRRCRSRSVNQSRE